MKQVHQLLTLSTLLLVIGTALGGGENDQSTTTQLYPTAPIDEINKTPSQVPGDQFSIAYGDNTITANLDVNASLSSIPSGLYKFQDNKFTQVSKNSGQAEDLNVGDAMFTKGKLYRIDKNGRTEAPAHSNTYTATGANEVTKLTPTYPTIFSGLTVVTKNLSVPNALHDLYWENFGIMDFLGWAVSVGALGVLTRYSYRHPGMCTIPVVLIQWWAPGINGFCEGIKSKYKKNRFSIINFEKLDIGKKDEKTQEKFIEDVAEDNGLVRFINLSKKIALGAVFFGFATWWSTFSQTQHSA